MDEVKEAFDQRMRGTNTFTRQYMEQVKKRLDIESDYALAKHLRVSKTTVSNYRNGYSAFSPTVAHRVAEILNIEPGIVVACMEVDRHSGADQKQRDTWNWIMQATKQAAGHAHVAVLAVIAAVGIVSTPSAHAVVTSPTAADAVSSVYYVKLNKRKKINPIQSPPRARWDPKTRRPRPSPPCRAGRTPPDAVAALSGCLRNGSRCRSC